MKVIETHIDISANAETVWKVLSDFDSYPDWNPFIRRISGKLKKGAALKVTIKPPGGRQLMVFPTVLSTQENFGFRWLGVLTAPFVFRGEHSFRIETRNGGVRFHHMQEFGGFLVPMLSKKIENSEKGFHEMNQALKARAESLL